ncbi:YwmB family TATA-box binding protein [Bacillaceae bacterium S4-13-58]
MRTKVITMVILIVMIVINGSPMIQGAGKIPELEDNIDFFQGENNVELDSWKVTLREEVPLSQQERVRKQILSYTQHANPTVREGHSSKVWSYKKKHSQFTEEFTIVESIDGSNVTELFYNVVGSQWDHEVKGEFYPIFNKAKHLFFQENSTNFTCIRLTGDGNIRSVLLLEKYLEKMEVEKLEKLEEKDFVAVSGYTPKWNAAIPISDKDSMNVQFGLRSGLGSGTTITIGTPIITSEY